MVIVLSTVRCRRDDSEKEIRSNRRITDILGF